MEKENGEQPGPTTVTDWCNFFREVCLEHYTRHPIKIGGPGTVVEIDESIKFKRKYNRGRIGADEQWVFGGVERESGRIFMIEVPNRRADTLLPIIQEYILPGTTIISDGWAAYNAISELPENYVHQV